jgi:hypothetical protein
MQMYRIKFARSIGGDLVDMGDVLVCAHSSEAAADMVVQVLGLERSQTHLDVSRIKPSLYTIDRHEIRESIATAHAGAVSADLATRATFPGVTESMPDEHWYCVIAQANARAIDENEAIKKLVRAIRQEMAGEPQKSSIKELEITVDRLNMHARSPAIERNAMYKVLRLFQGGSTRGK